jgi:hypothetical protein
LCRAHALLALATAAAVAAALRIVAVYAGIALPSWKVDDDPSK